MSGALSVPSGAPRESLSPWLVRLLKAVCAPGLAASASVLKASSVGHGCHVASPASRPQRTVLCLPRASASAVKASLGFPRARRADPGPSPHLKRCSPIISSKSLSPGQVTLAGSRNEDADVFRKPRVVRPAAGPPQHAPGPPRVLPPTLRRGNPREGALIAAFASAPPFARLRRHP